MIIGFDLDSTLVEDTSLLVACKELGAKFTLKDRVTWDPDFTPAINKRIIELWGDPEHMGNLKPLPNSLEKLQELKAAGHTLVLVTARDRSLTEATINLIRREFPNLFTVVNIAGNKNTAMSVDKNVILDRLGVELWVDDAPYQVEKTLSSGIPTILVSNSKTPYNWSKAKDPRLLQVVTDLGDLDVRELR